MITKIIELSVQNKTLLRKTNVVQGDSGRTLKCVITDYNIPENVTARIYAKKPSGKEIYNNCIIDKNAVLIKLTTQTLAEVGNVNCQLELSIDGERITTFEFLIVVEKSLISDMAIESLDERTILENLIDESGKAANAANNAANAANTATEKASGAASAASNAANAANNAANAANTATEKASGAASAASNAANAANNAANAANAAAERADSYALGGISDKTVTFEQATLRENLENGESTATLFGKIKKWLSDLGTAAFANVTERLDIGEDGTVLNGRVGKILADRIGDLETLATTAKTSLVVALNELNMKITGVSGLDIQYGTVPGTDVASKAYVDIDVTFPRAFTNPPVVVTGLASTSTGYGMGSTSVSCAAATKTGCTIRIFNNDTAPRKPAIKWIAVIRN